MMTNEEILDLILSELEKYHYTASDDDLDNTGIDIRTLSQLLNLKLTVSEERRYESILLDAGYVNYLNPPFKLLKITPKGLVFIDKGGYKNEQGDLSPNFGLDKTPEENLKAILEYFSIDKVETDTETFPVRDIIIQEFENLDSNEGWGYAFKNETDFNNFLKLLVKFFEKKRYELPQTAIKLKKRCKTRLAKTLYDIFNRIEEDEKLSSNLKYYDIIRILNHFRDNTNEEIYKLMTK